MPILTVNAGSSSVKLRLIGGDDAIVAERELAAPRAQVDPDELHAALAGALSGADAVVHRIVHGGERYVEATLIDGEVRRELGELADLAPLHQPKSLAALDAVSACLPGVPSVACFDTAFHATLPPAASTYALPAGWRRRWGLRRFGFHGLSHAWVARRARSFSPTPVRRGTSSRVTLAQARRSARSLMAARSTRRWGSPLSKAWSWPRAAAASTRAYCCGCLRERR